MSFSNEELVKALQEAAKDREDLQIDPRGFTTAWYAELMDIDVHEHALDQLKQMYRETGLIEPGWVRVDSMWGPTTVRGWRYVGDMPELDGRTLDSGAEGG